MIVTAATGLVLSGCKADIGNGDDIKTPVEDNNDVNNENNENINNEDNEVIVPPDDGNDDNIDNGEEDPEPIGGEEITDEPVVKPVTPKPSTGNNQTTTAVDKELVPYWNSINEIAIAAQNYYSENFNKAKLVSKNGKFYDSTVNEELNTQYLAKKGVLASKYKDYDCEILLLKTEDVSKYSNVSLKNDGTGMAVFVVAKNPKENSYLITTARSTGGIISNTDYISLLSGYGQNHGSVGRLMSGTDEYNRILNFVSMYEGKFDNYYVRSISKDNKYAVVVLSSQTNVNDLKEYILKKENNVWEVVMDKLENESRVSVAVNKKIPDFNPSLLPNYTIYDYKKLLMSDYTGVLHTLVKSNYVSSISDVEYIAGADKYCYVVLNNQIKYICFKNDGVWEIKQIVDYNEAYSFMTQKSLLAPTFIIWDR